MNIMMKTHWILIRNILFIKAIYLDKIINFLQILQMGNYSKK